MKVQEKGAEINALGVKVLLGNLLIPQTAWEGSHVSHQFNQTKWPSP